MAHCEACSEARVDRRHGCRRAGSSAIAGVDVIVRRRRRHRRLAACVEAGLTTYAQNVHWEPEGAYTGEISAPMLLGLGVTGRSSATRSGGSTSAETDRSVARRARVALESRDSA